jgi:Fur family transcriptional regulator, peroxide stress response regulator
VERDATRYCPNLSEHGHFMCERCGRIYDVPLVASRRVGRTWDLPAGFIVSHSDITLRGVCAECNR